MSPAVFLDLHFPKERAFLFQLSQFRVLKIAELCLTNADSYQRQIQKDAFGPKEWKFPLFYAMCIYYTLLTHCLRQRSIVEGEEVINKTLAEQFVKHFTFIQSSEFGSSTNFLRTTFYELLSAIGSHSMIVYDVFFTKLRTDVPKNIAMNMIAWRHLCNGVDQLKPALAHFPADLSFVPKEHRKSVCGGLQTMLELAFKRDHEAFVRLLDSDFEIAPARQLFETIDGWNEKDRQFAVPAQFLLLLLFDRCPESDFLSKLRSPTEPVSKYVSRALLVGWKAFTLSFGHSKVAAIMAGFFDQALAWYLSPKPSPAVTDAHVDLSIAALSLNPVVFSERIVPLLTQEKNDLSFYGARIIRRLSKLHAASANPPLLLFDPLIPLCTHVLKRGLADKDGRRILRPLVRAFTSYPTFLRLMLARGPGFATMFMQLVREHDQLQPQRAILGCFQFQFVEETEPSPATWAYFAILVHGLTSIYLKDSLYATSEFCESIPGIVQQIAEFILALIQFDPARGELWIADGLATFSEIETIGLVLVASSRTDARSAGMSILASLVEMVHASDAFETFRFPVDVYQDLVTESRNIANLTTGHASLRTALRVISIRSDGITAAWNQLFDSLLALTHAINPKIVLPSKPDRPITRPIADLGDEWVGVASLLWALLGDNTGNVKLSQLALSLLADNGDLAVYTIATIPTSLNVGSLMKMLVALNVRLRTFQTPDGEIDVSKFSAPFVCNVMKLVRGLTEQECWTPQLINVDAFKSLVLTLVSYCERANNSECRLFCAQSIVAVSRLLSAHEKVFSPKSRQRIAKTLLAWLSSLPDHPSKQYTLALATALAMSLDELALIDCADPGDPRPPEEQAIAQFLVFLAGIKSMLDGGDANSAGELTPVLAALLKRNLALGIEECISMGFAEKSSVRGAFIGALASVFRVPEPRQADAVEPDDDASLLDILFADTERFDLLDLLSTLVPHSRHDALGVAAVEAAVLRGVEFAFLGRMIDDEIASIPEVQKNTLFRGNAFPARVVGHYPRLVGTGWMAATLRPFFEEVVANSEERGHRYQVNPKQLKPGESIDDNRANFRWLLNRSIDVIADAHSTMPAGLVREAQMLYRKVYDKYGDFALQMMNGFLFLRFLLPTFTLTKTIGIPGQLPELPRMALLNCSTMLMIAALKGNLDDKGAHMSDYFNDVAARALARFTEMFHIIIARDVGDAKTDITVNEAAVAAAFQVELWPILEQITRKRDAMGRDDPLRRQMTRVINKVVAIGKPPTLRAKHASSILTQQEAARQEALFGLKFPDEALAQMADFVVACDQPTPDGSPIFVVNFARLALVTDPEIVPFLILTKLRDNPSDTIALVYLLGGFDDAKLPPPALIQLYVTMKPARKVTTVICVEPCEAFVTFVARNPRLLDRPGHFVFVKDLTELTDKVGGISKYLPPSAVSYLTKPETVVASEVNKRPMTVRLAENSVQFLAKPEKILTYELAAVTIITAGRIKRVEPPQAGAKKPIFHLTTKGGESYAICEPKGGGLYPAMSKMARRSKALRASWHRVKIDESTLNWLMLNLAFVNMVNGEVSPMVRKVALDLASAVFAAFNFRRTKKIQPTSVTALPESLLSLASQLSADIAEHNPASYAGFMGEVFKALPYTEARWAPSSFIVLQPWIPHWAADINSHPEFVPVLLKFFKAMATGPTTFSTNIWPGIVPSENAIALIMQAILAAMDVADIDVVTSIASLNPGPVTALWTRVFLEQSKLNAPNRLLYSAQVLSALIVAHSFDPESLTNVLYALVSLRSTFSADILKGCAPLLGNVFHIVARGRPPDDPNFPAMGPAFYTVLNEAGQPALDSLCVLATVFGRVLESSPIRKPLFDRFAADLQSDQPLVRATGLVFGATLTDDSAEFASAAFRGFAADDSWIAAVSAGLSCLNMDRALASRLFFVGVTFSLFSRTAGASGLLATAARRLGSEPDFCFAVPASAVSELRASCGVDLAADACLTAVLLMAAGPGDRAAFAEFLAGGSSAPAAMVAGLLFDGGNLDEVSALDFGDTSATIAAVVLRLLTVMPSEHLVRYATRLCQRYPGWFARLAGLETAVGRELLEKIENTEFRVALLEVQGVGEVEPGQRMSPILLRCFEKDAGDVRLDASQLQRLCGAVFK
jgi:hypothetical protein